MVFLRTRLARDVSQLFKIGSVEILDGDSYLWPYSLQHISFVLSKHVAQLTLRPPHLILNPGGALACCPHQNFTGLSHSLIFSVMFTILPAYTHGRVTNNQRLKRHSKQSSQRGSAVRLSRWKRFGVATSAPRRFGTSTSL